MRKLRSSRLNSALASLSALTYGTRVAALFGTLLWLVMLAILAESSPAKGACALAAMLLVLRLAFLFEDPMQQPDIVVTEQDADRLSRLLETLSPKQRSAVCALEVELERAQVVAARGVPGDVVTMNSRVVFEELHSGLRAEARLVYPNEAAKHEADAISILAPVGSALLGMRVGQSIDWRMPSGRLRRYQVVDVVYQPEAAGDLHL